MNDNRYNELIALIEEYGEACENFGNFPCDCYADRCCEAMEKIENFLKNA